MTTINKEKTEDVEIHCNNDSDHEIDEFLMEIYENNMKRIINISGVIKISQLIGIFSCFVFLVLLAVRVHKNSDFSWFCLLVPSLLTLAGFTILLNMYLKLKDIFDEAERQKEEEDVSKIGSILTYFCLNAISINLFIYTVLLCLKIENIIESQWNTIAIPLYITFGIVLFYFIFISPAFLQNKLYGEILIIFTYIACSFTLFILLNLKLDKSFLRGFLDIFIAGLFALGMHSIYLIFRTFYSLKAEILNRLSDLVLVLLSLISLVLVGLKADGLASAYDYWLPVALMTVGYILFVADKVTALLFGEKEEE